MDYSIRLKRRNNYIINNKYSYEINIVLGCSLWHLHIFFVYFELNEVIQRITLIFHCQVL